MLVERTAEQCALACIANLEMAADADSRAASRCTHQPSKDMYRERASAFREAIALIRSEFGMVAP